jgi:hypothetical protein
MVQQRDAQMGLICSNLGSASEVDLMREIAHPLPVIVKVVRNRVIAVPIRISIVKDHHTQDYISSDYHAPKGNGHILADHHKS